MYWSDGSERMRSREGADGYSCEEHVGEAMNCIPRGVVACMFIGGCIEAISTR